MSWGDGDGNRAGEEGSTYAACSISDHKHKGTAFGECVGRAFVVERRQTDAILFQTIRQRPRVGELQPWRHQQPDLLRQRAGEYLRRGRGARVEADEGKGRERGRLEGRGCAVRRRVDSIGHVARRRGGALLLGRRWRGSRLRGEFGQSSVEARDDVGDGVGEVGG